MDLNDWKNGIIWSTILAELATVQHNKRGELFYFQKCFYFLLSWKMNPSTKLYSPLTHSKLFQTDIVSRNIIKMIELHINKRWRLKNKGYNSFHNLEWDWKPAFHPFKKQSILPVHFSFLLSRNNHQPFAAKPPKKSEIIWNFG